MRNTAIVEFEDQFIFTLAETGYYGKTHQSFVECFAELPEKVKIIMHGLQRQG